MPWRTVLVAFLLVLPAAADELVMKDGKTIAWSSLKDLGESFEIETKDGVKLEVKKSDVSRIDFRSRNSDTSDAAKADAALTGASFTFDKSIKLTQFDLLKSVDVKAAASGEWKVTNHSGTHAQVTVPIRASLRPGPPTCPGPFGS